MRSKRIKIISAVLLILTALFMVGCREQSEISPIPAVTITSGGETVFSNSASGIIFAEQIKSGELEFKYEGDIPLKVKLSALQDEQEWSCAASFEKSGSTKISVEEGKLYCVSLEYYDEKAEKTVTSKYPANEEAFLKMLSPQGTGDNVVLGFAFEGELVNLQRPCNLILQEDLRCDTLYISGDFEGTLASKTGIHDVKDKVEICLPKNSKGSYVVAIESQEKKTATLFDSEKLGQKNKYEVFLGGNYDKVVIDTVSSSRATLLIIKDSYANALIPMLTPYFAKIVVVDPRYMTESIHNTMDEYNFSHVLFLYNLNTFLQDTSLVDALK